MTTTSPSTTRTLSATTTSTPIISASILAADFSRLGDEVNAALNAGADQIHFDVMDHHFVPNLSFGPLVCRALRQANISATIDVHLMVEHPTHYIDAFANAGANLICFHPSTVSDIEALIAQIRAAGMQAGLAFNPDEAIQISDTLLQSIDLVLLMTVYPGFGGQTFIADSIEKIRSTKSRLAACNSPAQLGVDGGIKHHNIHDCYTAGANFFVVGSELFHSKNYQHKMKELREALHLF